MLKGHRRRLADILISGTEEFKDKGAQHANESRRQAGESAMETSGKTSIGDEDYWCNENLAQDNGPACFLASNTAASLSFTEQTCSK